MSSSSSEAERLLRRAVSVLEAEAPTHARMFARALEELVVDIALTADAVSLSAHGDVMVVGAGTTERAQVRVKTTLVTALALVRGEVSAVGAIRAGSLDVFGEVSSLERAARAMEVFVHGLVRCPSGSTVVEELQRTIETRKAEGT